MERGERLKFDGRGTRGGEGTLFFVLFEKKCHAFLLYLSLHALAFASFLLLFLLILSFLLSLSLLLSSLPLPPSLI